MAIVDKRKITATSGAFTSVESAMDTVYTTDAQTLINTYLTNSEILDGSLILTRTFPDSSAQFWFDSARHILRSNGQYSKIEINWEPVE